VYFCQEKTQLRGKNLGLANLEIFQRPPKRAKSKLVTEFTIFQTKQRAATAVNKEPLQGAPLLVVSRSKEIVFRLIFFPPGKFPRVLEC